MSVTIAAERRGLERWAALGGVAYVILYIVGVILAFSGQPSGDASPDRVRLYYADSGHRDRVSVGWILVILGVFFFLWFLGSLREALRRTEGGGFLSVVAVFGGIVYAALTLAAIAVFMGITTMSDDTYQHTVFPELIHAANDTGYVLHASGGIGAGTMMIAASLVALQARAVAQWLGWLGVIAGILALGSIFFLPQILIAVWLVVVGIGLFLRPQGAQSAPR